MKRVLFTFCAALISLTSFSQNCSDLFFSEYIEGTSFNKAIEIYNPTGSMVNLSDYWVYRAVNGGSTPNDTLELSGMLAAGAVYTIADSGADAGLTGTADILDDITNYNGNDPIWLVKVSSGAVIDKIGEPGNNPGEAYAVRDTATKEVTLVRRPTVQEGTDDWSLGAFQWMTRPQNDFSDFGTHTMTACGTPVDTLVGFSFSKLTVEEDAGAVSIPVALGITNNPSTFSANVVLKSGTAADIDAFSTSGVSFSNGVAFMNVTVNVTDDATQEGAETFVLAIRDVTGNLMLSSDSLFTLTIAPSDQPIPLYDIATVRGNNIGGEPDSVGVVCQVAGTVYGINYRPAGLSFTINDGTAGIGVFAPTGNLGYTVQEGDSVLVEGEVGEFSGLSQMEFLTSVTLLGSGNTLPAPTVVTTLDESTEHELVRINGLTVTSSSPAGGATRYDVSNGSTTFEVYVDDDANIPALPTSGAIDVIGIGGQFNTTYQLLPRFPSDILSSVGIRELTAGEVNLFPNPVNDFLQMNILADVDLESLSIMDITGKTVYTQGINGNGVIKIDVSDLTTGVYVLHAVGDEVSFVTKVMVD